MPPAGQTNQVQTVFTVVNQMSGTLNQITRQMNNLTQQMQRYSVAANRANAGQVAAGRSAWSMHNNYKGLVGQVTNLNRAINIFGASIRQIGQGLQNFGTVFSIFVSVPMGLFIRNMLGGLMELQHQMIEVRKTTGITTEAMERMQETLQRMSLGTPTSPIDLAKMAADWGRLGIASESALAKLTMATDKFVIATNVTAQDATTKLGRIGNIFFDTTEEFVENIDGITSSIIALGNANAVTESEIISSFLRIAPYAEQLGILLPDALAMATTVSAVNVSPERAGTQLARALVQIVQKNEKIAELTGLTAANMEEMINLDPGSFFIDLLASIAQVESRFERINIAEEIFGGVGSRAALGIMSSIDLLADNIALARDQYDRATAAQEEFDAALDSVQNQVDILGNNFRYLGFTIAAEVMPYITKFSAMLIPILLAATDAFKELNDRTKLWIIAIGAISVALGPVLIMMGTLMFSLGIIITGMSGLVNQTLRTISGFANFGKVILSVISPLGMVRAAIIAVAGIFVWFANQVAEVNSFLGTQISTFFNWGFSLFESFADGMVATTGVITTALSGIIGIMAKFLQGFSPPKEGPLSNIDKWGENVGQSFVDGFSNVNVDLKDIGQKLREEAQKLASEFDRVNIDGVFKLGNRIGEELMNGIRNLDTRGRSMFGDIFGTVSSVIQAVGKNINLTTDAIEKRLMRAASVVRDFVANGGGLGDIAPWLGGMVGDIEDMVAAQNAYNKAQEDTKRIRKEIEDLDDSLDRELRAIAARTDLSLDERAAAIRSAKLRAQLRKDDLEDEEEAAKEREETLRDEVSATKDLISTLTGLIFPAVKLPEAEDGLGGLDFKGGTALDKINDAVEELESKFDDVNIGTFTFLTRIEAARERLDGFFSALRGEELHPFDIASGLISPDFLEGFKTGLEILKEIEPVKELYDDARESVVEFFETIGHLTSGFTMGFRRGFLGEDAADGGTLMENLSISEVVLDSSTEPDALGEQQFTERAQSVNRLGLGLFRFGLIVGFVSQQIDNLAEGFATTFDSERLSKLLDKDTVETFREFVKLLGEMLGLPTDNFSELVLELGKMIGHIVDVPITILDNFITKLAILVESLLLIVGRGDAERLGRHFKNLGENYADIAETFTEALTGGEVQEDESMGSRWAEATGRHLLTSNDLASRIFRGGSKLGFAMVGSDMGQNIIDGIKDFFTGPENEGSVTSSVRGFFGNVLHALTGNSLDDEIGEPMAMNVLQGFVATFSGENIDWAYNTITDSLTTWLEEKIIEIQDFGMAIGREVVNGLRIRFSAMFPDWSVISQSFIRWITFNRNTFLNLGRELGNSVVGGIKSAIINFWATVPATLLALMPDVANFVQNLIQSRSGNVTTLDTSSPGAARPQDPKAKAANVETPAFAAAGVDMNFVININGSNLSEKQLKRTIIDDVMNTLRDEIRKSGLL